MTLIDDPVVKDAADSALAALLVDRDVTEIASLEGGLLEVIRRGRRERLDAILEGPLFALLRESGAENGVIEMRLRTGHRMVAGPLADGRVALRVIKGAGVDAARDSLDVLVEEGMLPPGISEELVAAVLEGAGLAVIGPARHGRQRVLLAVARALTGQHSLAAVTEGTPMALQPLSARAPLEHRVEAAASLGADILVALELDVRDAAAIARARPALPLLASVASPSSDALTASLDAAGIPVGAVFGNVAVIGFGPDGRPRLAELHGPSRSGAGAPPSEPERGGSVDDDDRPARALPPSPPLAAPARAPDAASHDRPPGTWASDAPEMDPGWELADAGPPPAPGSFDAVLQSQKGRPGFIPRAPREHPQAQKLRGVPDPFGGLTFEPPSGGPDAPSETADGPDDEEPR